MRCMVLSKNPENKNPEKNPEKKIRKIKIRKKNPESKNPEKFIRNLFIIEDTTSGKSEDVRDNLIKSLFL